MNDLARVKHQISRVVTIQLNASNAQDLTKFSANKLHEIVFCECDNSLLVKKPLQQQAHIKRVKNNYSLRKVQLRHLTVNCSDTYQDYKISV